MTSLRPSRLFLALLAAASMASQAAVPELCQRTPAASPTRLLVLDASFKPVRGKVLDVGRITTTGPRSATPVWYVVSPLRADPNTTLPGRDMQSLFELAQKCPGKKVYRLSLTFDGTTLAPGPISERFAIYQDEFGMKGPPIAADIEVVEGMLERTWLVPSLSASGDANAPAFDLLIINGGNVTTQPLAFDELSVDASGVKVMRNDCAKRVLAPGASCHVMLSDVKRVPSREGAEWIVDTGAQESAHLFIDHQQAMPDVFVVHR